MGDKNVVRFAPRTLARLATHIWTGQVRLERRRFSRRAVVGRGQDLNLSLWCFTQDQGSWCFLSIMYSVKHFGMTWLPAYLPLPLPLTLHACHTILCPCHPIFPSLFSCAVSFSCPSPCALSCRLAGTEQGQHACACPGVAAQHAA